MSRSPRMEEPATPATRKGRHKLRHGPLSYDIFRKVDSLQLHAPFDQKEKELCDKRSKCHDTGRREERLATRIRQFLNVLVGISVGLAAVVVRYGSESLGGTRRAFFLKMLEPGGWPGMLVAVPITAAFACLATLVVVLVPASTGSGIPGVLAFLNGVDLRSGLRGPVLLAKVVGTVLSVGGGLALGPEGPMVHIGATVGMLVCRRCLSPALRCLGPFGAGLEEELARQPLRFHVQAAVMGAGAGIAAAFNAPLAGTVFVVEEAASFFSKKLLLHSFICSAFAVLTCNVVSHLINLPIESIYTRTGACIGVIQAWIDSPWMVVHVVVVGVLSSLLAILFNRIVVALSIYFAEEAQRLGRGPGLFLRRFAFSLFIGACCGAFAVGLPQSLPCRDSSLQNAFHGSSGCVMERWLQQLVSGGHYVNSSLLPKEFRDDKGNLTMSYQPNPGLFAAQYDPLHCPVAVELLPECRVKNIEQFIERASDLKDLNLKAADFCCRFRDITSLSKGEYFNISEPSTPMDMGEDWPRGPCEIRTWNPQEKVYMDHYSPAAALTLVPPSTAVRNLLVRGAPGVLPLATLGAFVVGYFLLAALSSTAWMPGGLLVPMMCIGAAFGRLYGMVWQQVQGAAPPLQAMPWMPELKPMLQALYPESQPLGALPMEPGILAFAGCAAFLSGSGSLVMFVLVLLLEVTMEPFLIPVIMISILSARTVTSLLKAHGLYHELMNVQSLPFLSETPHWRQSHYVVEDLLRQDAKTQRELRDEETPMPPARFEREFPQLISLSKRATEAEIVEALERRLPGDHNEVHGFPVVEPASVVEPGGQLCGLVTREALLSLLVRRENRERSNRELLALPAGLEDVMDSAPFVVQGSTPVVHAHMLFARCGLRHVVVVDSGHRPIGILTRKSLMPWRTPWLDEDNLHHDTFLEQRAAHSPSHSRGNSPPNTPPLSRQNSYQLPRERSQSFRERANSEAREVGILSPLAESLRFTAVTAEEADERVVLEGADGPEASRPSQEG